ncbi:hypothetical protein Tco_0057622 [Tanacetum coccineum]
MNGWLIEDEEEVERNEVDSDLESTASSKPVWKKTTKADHDRTSPNWKSLKGVDFGRWQKKMHFMLSSMSVVYVLTAPMLEDGGENPTVEQVRKRAKWDNDDYVCRGLILNGMSDSLFDVYQNVETPKVLLGYWKAKYIG